MSFRTRLLATSMLTLVVGLGALLIAGNVLLEHRVRVEASNLLHARVEAQVAALSVTARGVAVRETPNDAVLDRSSWVIDGRRVLERPAGVSPALDRVAIALGRRHAVAERDGPSATRLRAQPVGRAGAVVVALSVKPLERLEQEVLIGSLVVAALVLLAGGVAIRGAVTGALRPVAQMTADAEAWGATDLDRRFDLGAPRDEITGLAATLDHLLGRIAASRRHEQRFASEVAHELRTPLAGIRAHAELALRDRGDDAVLATVIERSDRLSAAIDALIALARGDQATSGTTDLRALVDELGVSVVADGAIPPADGDPELIRRALAPLLENARRHAREHVSVELSASGGRVRVTVRDDGPGLDPRVGQRAFEPGVRGADAHDGAGLGLPLAQRLARSCGGDVTAGDGPGGCFVLELPAAGYPPATSRRVKTSSDATSAGTA